MVRALVATALLLGGTARAGEVYDPGQGALGTLLFEDLWPCNGDRDFNDLVLRYNYRREVDGVGQTTSLTLTLDVGAVGATLCGGIGLRLPVPVGSVASASRRLGAAGVPDGVPWDDPQAWSLADVQRVSTSGSDTVFWLTDDVRGELCGGADGFLDTVVGEPPVACRPLVLDVTFTGPVALDPQEPYDLFLFRCGDRPHQVHRTIYPGLDAGFPFAADPSLFGACDDLDDGRNYVSADPAGLPFVLNLGEGNGQQATAPAAYPREQHDIALAFPDILEFADGPGDGVSAYDFYLTGDPDHQYTDAAPPGALLPQGAFDADGDGFCEGFDADGLPSTPPVCFTATESGGDCDEVDPTRSPGAAEVCNGVDTDCDGLVDDSPTCVPTITGIDGDGSFLDVADVGGQTAGLGDAVDAGHRFGGQWVVSGTHLDQITSFTLASTTGGPTFTETDGLQFVPGGTPMQRTLNLPAALQAGSFLLTLTAPAGSAMAQTFVLQGEPGLACWDADENGACDGAEDADHSGTCDVADCQLLALDCTEGQRPLYAGGAWTCESVSAELQGITSLGIGTPAVPGVALSVGGTIAAGPTGTCDPDHLGEIARDALGIRVCDGANWATVTVVSVLDGSSDVKAAVSCATLHAAFPAKPSSTYWVAPTGTPFQAWCDMSTDGGGWTLVGAWAPMAGYAMYNYSATGRLPDEVRTSYASPRAAGSGAGQGPAHYSAAVISALFHNGSRQYLTVTGRASGGAIVARHTKSSPNLGYDAFRGVYNTQYMASNGFTVLALNTGANANPLPIPTPAWGSYPTTGRTCADPPAGIDCYHYLPDDMTEGGEWLFRENSDNTPYASYTGSENVPSLLFVR